MPGELLWTLVAVALTALSLVVPGGRVMTIPFFFVVILVLIFWSARRAAERQDADEEG
ncbi:MAG TPA: hypothetical protein VKA21_06720 [Candidatus Binatia bacterium]|nr:hypothetical protein [Candidatus Binatia bacterium]